MDGLPIILDKSALEMLGPDELNALAKHYFLIVPPILMTEIIGDLYSKRRNSKQEGIQTELVQSLATKIAVNEACRNIDYRDIREADLLGYNVDQGGFRPFIAPTQTAFDDDGKEMALIVQDEEMKLILQWQKGNFSLDDNNYAKVWKESTPVDLEKYKRDLVESKFLIEGSDLVEIRANLESQFKSGNQYALLAYSCSRANLSPEDILMVCRRWERAGQPMFCDFAPYAYYCALVDQVFACGLVKDLVRTSRKAKSDVDLQYVYYFPFTRVFGSHDRFHSNFWEVFGDQKQQVFVWGESFKRDLKAINDYWTNSSDEELSLLRASAPHPPILDSSLSVGIFDKMVALGRLSSRQKSIQFRRRVRNPEEDKATVERIISKYKKFKDDHSH